MDLSALEEGEVGIYSRPQVSALEEGEVCIYSRSLGHGVSI